VDFSQGVPYQNTVCITCHRWYSPLGLILGAYDDDDDNNNNNNNVDFTPYARMTKKW